MPKPEDKPQIEKFREAARKLKIDDSDAPFEAAVAKVATSPKLTNDEIKALARQLRQKEPPSS